MAPNRIVAPRRREEIVQATIRCMARQGYTRLTKVVQFCYEAVEQYLHP